VSDAYLIGTKNLQAETLEYKNRVTAEGEAVSARLEAEGEAHAGQGAGRVRDQAERAVRLAGRPRLRRVAAAGKVTFAKELTFSSQDGIPSMLRLRRFAEQFMGQ
jgi:regulator of protease activity HflC (stomatin/prohibitin superfamily)